MIVPAALDVPCTARELPLLSTAFSDAIGGGLLDEALHGSFDGADFTVYLDEDRSRHGLPANDRAATLSAALGYPDPRWLASLRGDALVLGRDPRTDDTDVPATVLDTARTLGLLPGPGRSPD